MELEEIFDLFLEGCLSFSLKEQFISFLIFFQNIGMICIDMFPQFSYIIGCVI